MTMKTNKLKIIFLLPIIFALSCEQELTTLKDPCEVDPESCAPNTECDDATKGDLDLTKFIALGNSFVAGFQGGALYTEGQDNSLAKIINTQFDCARENPATFNQPTIGATLGWNLFVTQPFLSNGTSPIIGRMKLQYGSNTSCATGLPTPLPTPQLYGAGNLEALPDPNNNPGFLYSGTTSELNNFSVPAITVGQTLISAAGNWASPNQYLVMLQHQAELLHWYG
jgi:hypothetical protein